MYDDGISSSGMSLFGILELYFMLTGSAVSLSSVIESSFVGSGCIF